MVRPEMRASHDTGSEVLVKNHEEKGWICRMLDGDAEPQDGNPCSRPASRSSKHLLTGSYSQ